MVKEAGISPTTIRRVVGIDLLLTLYKLKRRQMLKEKMKLKRLERSKKLLRKAFSTLACSKNWCSQMGN